MACTTLERLRQGRVPIGDGAVTLDADYLDVFRLVPGFPEEPVFTWQESTAGTDGPGARYDRFEIEREWLGMAPCRLEFVFRNGRLWSVDSEDPDDPPSQDVDAPSDGDPMTGDHEWWRGFRDRLSQHHRRVADFVTRFGTPAAEVGTGLHDHRACWRFGTMELVVYVESRSPSTGIRVRFAEHQR